MKVKRFAARGAYWYTVNKSKLGKDYVLITRPLSLSELKRKGMYVTSIDFPVKDLPERVYNEAKEEGIIE
jgi:hypothetical protein